MWTDRIFLKYHTAHKSVPMHTNPISQNILTTSQPQTIIHNAPELQQT